MWRNTGASIRHFLRTPITQEFSGNSFYQLHAHLLHKMNISKLRLPLQGYNVWQDQRQKNNLYRRTGGLAREAPCQIIRPSSLSSLFPYQSSRGTEFWGIILCGVLALFLNPLSTWGGEKISECCSQPRRSEFPRSLRGCQAFNEVRWPFSCTADLG